MKLVSKSRFLQYLECPKDAWFRLHMPDLPEFEVSTSEQGRMDQGYEVEDYAKQLKIFEGFVEVQSRGFKEFKADVDVYLEQRVSALFQASFVADGFIIRCDFLVWNKKTKKWDLYEVKGTNSKKDDDGPRDHISDLAFQSVVLERYGVEVGDKYIVHLNPAYIRGEEINVEELFVISLSTEQVAAKRAETIEAMEKAKAYLNQEHEPATGCDCHLYGRSSHCVTFSLSHPEIPEYSVHDLSRIGSSQAKLNQLINDGVYSIEDIKNISEFSLIQQNQINVHQTGADIIVAEEIKSILDGYTYPLYFFDYETFAPAIPVFPGYGTYQRIPIQFSLHVIEKEGGELCHVDYVHTDNSDPSLAVAKLLADTIDPKGTVLAWNVGFERGVTAELAERLPDYKKVLMRICDQMEDLRDPFAKQHYVHKDFRGRVGIEAVMQVLLPEMNYDDLPYTGSDVGYVWWNDIVNSGEEPSQREEKIHLIREYCKQDTLVMVKIWEVLKNL